MTVEKIIPCVCIDHEPTSADSVYYGMPQLKVSNSISKHKQFWSAFCPKCGRGGCLEYKSAYLALRHWNELMESLWRFEKQKNPIFEIQ